MDAPGLQPEISRIHLLSHMDAPKSAGLAGVNMRARDFAVVAGLAYLSV